MGCIQGDWSSRPVYGCFFWFLLLIIQMFHNPLFPIQVQLKLKLVLKTTLRSFANNWPEQKKSYFSLKE